MARGLDAQVNQSRRQLLRRPCSQRFKSFDSLGMGHTECRLPNLIAGHGSVSAVSADTGKLLWARYQYALIQRVAAESLLAHTGGHTTERIERLLNSADALLADLATSDHRSMRISATHQRGVVMWVRGQLESAALSFTQCIAERGRQRPQSAAIRLRRAYSYRRRAMVWAKMAKLRQARRDWHQAEALACQDHCHENKRLLREIQRDRLAWLSDQDASS